jgi:hypothetical protein
MVYTEALVVFAFADFCSFSILQSRVHETWARFFGSSIEDRLRYTPSDCFETFPFPLNVQLEPTLEIAGREYYEFRAASMLSNNQGLTAIYNRFHDPGEGSPEIVRLRELHSRLDQSVLEAYGWTDIQITSEFLLDYDEENGETTGQRRKKPWRYRWPDAIRDEVLARLLELNRQRALTEAVAGEAQSGTASVKPPRGRSRKNKSSAGLPLVPGLLGEEKQ